MMEIVKRELIGDMELDVNGNVVELQMEDINSSLGQQVVSMSEVVLILGSKGIVPWDAVLDWSENRWRLQDGRDEVSGFIMYFD